MGKVEINNEIIKLRHVVRKAKLRIIHNLTREIKILRVKRGDERKLAKSKRRADRFYEEVMAAKKVEDDEVTKFAIVSTQSLFAILNDPKSDATLRVTAKFANFAEIQEKVAEFKAKFPNYEQFLGPGRKKLLKEQMKAVKKDLKEKEKERKREENLEKDEENEKKKMKKRNRIDVANSSDDEEASVYSDNEMDGSAEENDESDEDEVIKERMIKREDLDSEETSGKSEDDDSSNEFEKYSKAKLKHENTKRSKLASENSSNSEAESEEVQKALKQNKKQKTNKKLKPTSENSTDSEAESENLRKASKALKQNKKHEIKKLKPTSENSSDSEAEFKEMQKAGKVSKRNKRNKLTKKLKSISENWTDSESESEKVRKLSKSVLKQQKEKHKKEEEKKLKDAKPLQIKSVSKEATVAKFFDLLKEKETQEPSKKIKSPLKSEKVEVKKVVDEFFMTSDGGEKYMSVFIPRKTTNEPKDDSKDEDFSHQGGAFSRNREDRFFSKMDNFERRPDKFAKNKTNKPKERKFESKFEKPGRNEAKDAGKFTYKFEKKTETPQADLHPSWAAKKKQQDALKLGFQGKKIIFDD